MTAKETSKRMRRSPVRSLPAWSRKTLLLLLGILPVVLIYTANPNNRVYSYHGLSHASVTYQIANNTIPPSHPFLAGYPLRYHWGYHLLAAMCGKAFNMSPFVAFAAINTLSLLFCLVLVYRISARLVSNGLANATSAFIALYAVTLISPRIINDYVSPRFQALEFVDWRGVPVYEKFSNSNGVPLGVVFFLLCVYALVGFSEGRWTLRNALVVFVSVVGCAFFYPPMLPGLLVGLAATWIVLVVLKQGIVVRERLYRSALLLVSGVLGLLVALPYLRSVSSGLATRMAFFSPPDMMSNLLNLGFCLLPLGVLIFWQRRELRKEVRREPLVTLLAICLANAIIYVVIRQPIGTEYKYLLMSAMSLGIAGGVAVASIKERLGMWPYLVVLAVGLVNPLYETTKKLAWRANDSVIYVERGRDVRFKNRAEEELYQWIRESTPRESAFIDTGKFIPVFGQRALYASFDRMRLGVEDVYEFFFVADSAQLRKRQTLARKIADGTALDAGEKAELQTLGRPLFVVDRQGKLPGDLAQGEWELTFTTSSLRHRVYRYVGNEH